MDPTGADESQVGLIEGMATCRSIHRYLPDPIPDKDLNTILYSATRAPSGTNAQPFRFLTLRDGERALRAKAILGDSFRRGWAEKMGSESWDSGSGAKRTSRKARTVRSMEQFVANFEKIPVVVLACLHRHRAPEPHEGASIYPACQNILLSARALGYGGCISMWHVGAENTLRELLEIPEKVGISATITLGKPEGRHGPLRRLPVQQLIYDDVWLGPAEWAVDPPNSRFSRGGPGVDRFREGAQRV